MSETELIQKRKRAKIIWKGIAGYHPLSNEETVAEGLEVFSQFRKTTCLVFPSILCSNFL